MAASPAPFLFGDALLQQDTKPARESRAAHRSSRSSAAAGVVTRISGGLLALVAFVVLASVARLHPLSLSVVLGVAAIAFVIFLRWPGSWLFVLPALLPVANFAPWTGSLYLEEFDLLALAAIAAAAANAAWRGRGAISVAATASTGRLAAGLFVLLALSYLIALMRGLLPMPAWDYAVLADYNSRWNAVRIGKGFVLAFALLPFLVTALRREPQVATRRLLNGMGVGLALASLAVLWERLAFTGLANFASDYRATGSFWDMHVGGAPLDGYLSLAFPLAIGQLMVARTTRTQALAAALVTLSAYAVLVTFTRSTYAAIAIGVVLAFALQFGVSVVARRDRALRDLTLPGRTRFDPRPIVLALALVVGCTATFASGGYRALLAVIATFGVALLAGHTLRGSSMSTLAIGAGFGLMLGAVTIVATMVFAKAAYVAVAAAGLLVAACAPEALRDAPRRVRAALGAGFVWIACAALAVAGGWGGAAAIPGTALAIAVIVVGVFWNVRAHAPLWQWRRSTLSGGFVFATVAAALSVGLSSTYVMLRFGQSSGDLSGRIGHWSRSFELSHGGLASVFGNGLGRFPSEYAARMRVGELPGSHRYEVQAGNRLLALVGPELPAGYGGPIRVVQEIAVDPRAPLVATLRVLSDRDAQILVEVCDKHLLYPGACLQAYRGLKAAASVADWTELVLPLAGRLQSGPWYAPPLQVFALSVHTPNAVVRFDDIGLVSTSGGERLANGNFNEAWKRWFFTSDRAHLPWHAKSLWLGVLFDQGLLGLVAFAALWLTAIARLTFGVGRMHPLAPFLAGALVAFSVAATFDTMIDAPRITFLVFLLAGVALTLRPLSTQATGQTAPLPEAPRRSRSRSRRPRDAQSSAAPIPGHSIR